MSRRAALAAALVTLAAPAAPAALLEAQGVCDGRPIREIRVDVSNIFSTDDSVIPGFVRGLGNALHWRTHADLVELDLLFHVGDPCDLRRLRETERLLRARPYIRSAVVVPLATADSGVEVFVETRDEASLEGHLQVGAGGDSPFKHVSLGEENLLGRGLRLQAQYTDVGRRASYYGDYEQTHLMGQRVQTELEAGKSEVGPVMEETVRRDFESDFDRIAWRESVRYRKEPFPLVSTELGTVLEPQVEIGQDAGVALRLGEPGQLRIVGLALSNEWLRVEGAPLAPTPDQDSAAAALLGGRFDERRRVRAHLLLGARRIVFHPHRGLDAVNAIEDAQEGMQGGLVLGKSLFGGAGLQHDWFAAMELSTGTDIGGALLVFSRAKVEGRYLESAGRWDGILADGEVLVYAIGPRQTTVVSATAAGGFDTRTPFQLLLAGPDGLRGYGSSAVPVGRRIVVRAERRYLLGTAFGFADLGAAVFAETGRGWAGDAAFGENSGQLGTIGAGLRVAAPRGSRRTYRLDVAMPLTRGLGPELRLAVGQQFGIFHGEPQDVVRSRERISSVTVFDFPRF
ncbi:MAG TPA: hypothetical protein VEH83_06650 [Gemmatimonadales bacterium]|nr:hypothetical protein [Gemmatimonadales bacterium]